MVVRGKLECYSSGTFLLLETGSLIVLELHQVGWAGSREPLLCASHLAIAGIAKAHHCAWLSVYMSAGYPDS